MALVQVIIVGGGGGVSINWSGAYLFLLLFAAASHLLYIFLSTYTSPYCTIRSKPRSSTARMWNVLTRVMDAVPN
jgi:hypothetical protein